MRYSSKYRVAVFLKISDDYFLNIPLLPQVFQEIGIDWTTHQDKIIDDVPVMCVKIGGLRGKQAPV